MSFYNMPQYVNSAVGQLADGQSSMVGGLRFGLSGQLRLAQSWPGISQ